MASTMSPQQFSRAIALLARDRSWRPELKRAYRPVSNLAARMSRAEMRTSGDRQLAAAARGVRGNASALGAQIRVSGRVPTSTTTMSALAPVYGTKGRTGWFAKPRYAMSGSRNNPSWIGNNWTVGVRGEGPRGVNAAIAEGQEQIVDEFETATVAMLKRAFPNLR